MTLPIGREKKITLYSLWFGPLPAWIDRFIERVQAIDIVRWHIVTDGLPNAATSVFSCTFDRFKFFASGALNIPVRKKSPYSLCDLRPAFGELFQPATPWWGWCDLDIVLGDLDRLLPTLMEGYQLVTDHSRIANGPFTIVRNEPRMNLLWRSSYQAWQVAGEDYYKFDEVGFTLLLDGLRVRFADMHAHDGEPRPGCSVQGPKLFDANGRELLVYHFSKGKAWPL